MTDPPWKGPVERSHPAIGMMIRVPKSQDGQQIDQGRSGAVELGTAMRLGITRFAGARQCVPRGCVHTKRAGSEIMILNGVPSSDGRVSNVIGPTGTMNMTVLNTSEARPSGRKSRRSTMTGDVALLASVPDELIKSPALAESGRAIPAKSAMKQHVAVNRRVRLSIRFPL